MTELSRRAYLAATGIAAAGTVSLAGCADRAAATGTLATQVTDQPGDITDFESCVVTIEGIWVKPGDGSGDDGAATNETEDGETAGEEPSVNDTEMDGDTPVNDTEMADGEGPVDDGAMEEDGQGGEAGVDGQAEDDVDESGGREYYEFEEPQEADLVELQDGNTALVDERELEVRTYEFLQLDVSNVKGVLDGGEETEVDTPGNAPLQFKEPFEIRADETTTFTGDFTPVRRGQTGRYLLQPVASGTAVEYES